MYDPLDYLNDPEKPKYDEALDPLDPRKLRYIPPPSPRLAQEPPPVDAPEPIPAQSAGPQLPAWRTADDARESTRTALNADEELKQTIANRPRLQHAKGWKGALQTVGEMFLNPAVIHPNYTRQMDEYGQDVNAAEARAKIAANQAEQQRRQAQAEAQGDLWAKQGNTAEYQQKKIEWEMAHPGKKYMSLGNGGVFDETEGKVIVPPTVKAPTPTREEMDAAGEARRTKMADQMGLKGPDRINYIAGKNVIRPPKVAGSGGQASQKDFRVIENNKNNAMLKAKVAAQKAEAKIKADPNIMLTPEQRQEAIAKVWSDYDDQMSQIQNGYESNILAAGGSIAPRAPGPPPPPPSPAAGQKLLREFTSKSGHVFKAGQPAKTKDGKEGIIKGFNPDGSVVFE